MKKTIIRKNGDVEVFEGSAEEIAELERTLVEQGEQVATVEGAKKPRGKRRLLNEEQRAEMRHIAKEESEKIAQKYGAPIIWPYIVNDPPYYDPTLAFTRGSGTGSRGCIQCRNAVMGIVGPWRCSSCGTLYDVGSTIVCGALIRGGLEPLSSTNTRITMTAGDQGSPGSASNFGPWMFSQNSSAQAEA